jgi:hypothetical protein
MSTSPDKEIAMFRRLTVGLLLLAATLAGVWVNDLLAQRFQNAPYSPGKTPEASESPVVPPPNPIVADILSIRAGEKDADRDPQEESEFADALRKLVAEKQNPTTTPASTGSAPERLPTARPPVGPSSDVDAVAVLRHSARLLDSIAAKYEDDGRYADADRVRKTAQRMRVEARALGESSEKIFSFFLGFQR